VEKRTPFAKFISRREVVPENRGSASFGNQLNIRSKYTKP